MKRRTVADMFRRALLALAGLLFATIAQAQVSIGLIGWNGKYTQTSLGLFTAVPFVDALKANGEWKHLNTNTPVNVSLMNANGYPTSDADFSPNPWYNGISLPSSGERAGPYTSDWVGYASIKYANGGTISGVNPACSSTGSGAQVTVTGVNCYVTDTNPPASGGLVEILDVGTGSPNPQLTQLRFYNQADATAVTTCYAGITSGAVYDDRLKSCFAGQFLLALADFGVIRFINVEFENEVGVVTALTSWEQSTPLTWDCWQCTYYPPQNFTANQITLASGAEYTLADPGFALTDKATVVAQFAAAITIPSANTNATSCPSTPGGCTNGCVAQSGSTQGTCVLSFATVPASVVAGMLVGDHSQNSFVAATATVQSVNFVANTVTITCQLNCQTPIFSGKTVGNGDLIYFSPMVNINGTGYVSMALPAGDGWGTISNSVGPINATYSVLTYSATLNVVMVQNGASNTGVSSFWPPAIKVALANAVGAHLWTNLPCYVFDNPNGSDYVAMLAAFNRTWLTASLIQRIEGPDEIWNYVYSCTTFADIIQFTLSGVNFDHDNWYGTGLSKAGQIVSAAFGNPTAAARPSLYHVVDGTSAGDDSGLPTRGGGGQDKKLASPWYVSQGGSAAYNWATSVAFASYYQSSCTDTLNEVGWAYAYSKSPSTALIAAFLNSASPPISPACGVNANVANTLHALQVTTYPAFANYVSSYVNAGFPFLLEQYEGHYETNTGGFNTGVQKATIASFTPGSPTVLTINANAWNYICNTASLCNGTTPTGLIGAGFTGAISGTALTVSGVTGTIAVGQTLSDGGGSIAAGTVITAGSGTSWTVNNSQSVGSEAMGSGTGCFALDGKDPAIQSATLSTITVSLNSTGCSTSATGSIVYDGASGSAGWMQAFEVAVMQDTTATSLRRCELASLQSFRASGLLATPVPVTAEFPSIYDLSDGTAWAAYYTDLYQTNIPAIFAVRDFQATPAGPGTCSP